MRYVTYGGEIEELTEEDLLEAVARMSGGYQPAGRRAIPVERGLVEIELFSIPERELDGITARSPIIWRASHSDGLPAHVDITKLHGEVMDIRLLHVAVRRALSQLLKSVAGNFWAQARVRAIADILEASGWPASRESIELSESWNVHYFTWADAPALSEVRRKVAVMISEAKQKHAKALSDNNLTTLAAHVALQGFGLANFSDPSIGATESPEGNQQSVWTFNKPLDAQVVFARQPSGSTEIFVSTLRGRKALPLASLFAIVDEVKRAKD
jgi:hypothetical protein